MDIRLREKAGRVSDERRSHSLGDLVEKILPGPGFKDSYRSGKGSGLSRGGFAGPGPLWRPDSRASVAANGDSGTLPESGELPTGGFVPDFAQPHRPIGAGSGDEDRRSDFIRSLTALRERGVKLKMVPAVFVKVEDVSDQDYPYVQELLNVIYQTSFFEATDGQGSDGKKNLTILDKGDLDPQAYLEASFGQVLLSDPDLVDTRAKGNRRAHVVPYTISFSTEGEELHVTALNWVTGKTVFDVYYSRADRSLQHWQTLADQMGRALELDFIFSGFRRLVKELPELDARDRLDYEDDYLYGDGDMLPWETGEVRAADKAWRSLLGDFDVTFVSQPEGSNVDSLVRHVPLKLEAENFSERDAAPFNVDGHVEAFVIEPKNLRTKLRLAADPLMKKYVETEYVEDKYGNIIIPMFSLVGKKRKTLVFDSFQVIPPRRLSHDQKNPDETFAPLGVDLTAFGFGDYPLLAKSSVEQAVSAPTSDRPYFLYSQVSDKTPEEQDAAYLRVAAEAAGVERFFGLNPGDAVKAISLTPSQEENATVSFTNPDTIQVWDEFFSAVGEGDGRFIGSHESFHIMDFHFGLSEDEEVKTAFRTMSDSYDKALFGLIDEKSYLENGGGHSADNVREFVASLLNTVYTGKFDAKIAETDDRTRGLYYRALEALQHAIRKNDRIGEDAPVALLLADAMGRVSNGREYIPAIGELIVPGMEDILMPSRLPATPQELLSDFPVPVLSAADFKATVLQGKGVSFIYVYNANEQENAPLIKRSALGLAASGKFLQAMPYDQAEHFLGQFGNELRGSRVYIFENGRVRGYMSVEELHVMTDEFFSTGPLIPGLPIMGPEWGL